MIKVALADDQPIFRLAMREILASAEFEVVAEFSDGQDLLGRLGEFDLDVLLLEPLMANLEFIDLQTLLRDNPRIKVVLLTVCEDQHIFAEALKFGCFGIVMKQIDPNEIRNLLRKVCSGNIWLDPMATSKIVSAFLKPPSDSGGRVPLSARERQVVGLIAQGLKNKEIMGLLFISEQTVKNHIHSIFGKLGFSSRTEVAIYGVNRGMHLPVPVSRGISLADDAVVH
ncbi:MAG TPA: response regulator transcription factor [Candidatus Paceibacterota bacterium]